MARAGGVVRSGDLSDMALAWADAVINGVDEKTAAKIAGYKNHRQAAYQLRNDPKVQKYLRKSRQAYIAGELSHLALSAYKSLLTDKEVPAETKRKAAKDVLEMAGHGQKDQQNQEGNFNKPLSEMSLDELNALHAQAQDKLSRMTVVSDKASQQIEGEAQVIEEIDKSQV